MGCDWHPYLEVQSDNGLWEPAWEPVLHPLHWWESLIDKKIKNGAINLAFATIDEDERYAAAEHYFENLDLKEAAKTYSKDVYRLWREHTNKIAWDKHRFDSGATWNIFWANREYFSGRDYQWFSYFGVRGDSDLSLPIMEGVPDDMSWQIQEEWDRGRGDWHSPHHFMVDEFVKAMDQQDIKTDQGEWLKKFAPKESRLVFWFDN